MTLVKGRSTLPRTKMTTDAQVFRARAWLVVLLVASVLTFVLVAAFLVAAARSGAL